MFFICGLLILLLVVPITIRIFDNTLATVIFVVISAICFTIEITQANLIDSCNKFQQFTYRDDMYICHKKESK